MLLRRRGFGSGSCLRSCLMIRVWLAQQCRLFEMVCLFAPTAHQHVKTQAPCAECPGCHPVCADACQSHGAHRACCYQPHISALARGPCGGRTCRTARLDAATVRLSCANSTRCTNSGRLPAPPPAPPGSPATAASPPAGAPSGASTAPGAMLPPALPTTAAGAAPPAESPPCEGSPTASTAGFSRCTETWSPLRAGPGASLGHSRQRITPRRGGRGRGGDQARQRLRRAVPQRQVLRAAQVCQALVKQRRRARGAQRGPRGLGQLGVRAQPRVVVRLIHLGVVRVAEILKTLRM